MRWWGCGGELEGSENHLDYPLSEFGNSRVGMSDWEVGVGGSKGDSGVVTASVVATLSALGAFTSSSSSSSLSATPTPTGSGDEGLKGY